MNSKQLEFEKQYIQKLDKINLDNYFYWYKILGIKYKIIKYTFNREFSIKPYNKQMATRYLRLHNVQHLDVFLKAFNWRKNKYNLYYTLARYRNGIPKFNLDLANRNTNDWKMNHWKEMETNDLLIDIDADKHEDMKYALSSCKQIVKLLRSDSITFEIRFSGMGFHIIVPYSYFENNFNVSFEPKAENSIYKLYTRITKKINTKISQMVDNINDSRRLCKIPYSLSLYDDEIYVCKPLSLQELYNFNLKYMKPQYVLKEVINAQNNISGRYRKNGRKNR